MREIVFRTGSIYSVLSASLVWSFLLLTSQANGQPLDTLLAMAHRSNPEMRASDMQYRAALEQRDQVNQLPDPELGLGIFVLPVETRLGPQQLRFSATQALPWMGSLSAREDLAMARARGEFFNTEISRLEVDFAIRQAYFRLYELNESQEVLSANLDLYRSLESLSLTRVESGEASAADVLRVQLRINALRQEIQRMENEKSRALATLNENLNRPFNTPVSVTDTLPFAPLALNRDTLLDYLQTRHPRLRQLGAQQTVAEQEIEVNELNTRPSFTVGLDYIMTGKRKDAEVEHNGRDGLMLRGAVKVPLFTDQYAARERQERLRIDALEQQKRSWENRYLAELEKAYTDYRDAALQLELYRDQQQTLSSALDILTARYSNEGAGFDELLNLYIEQSEYDLGIVRAIVKSHQALAAIDRLIDLN